MAPLALRQSGTPYYLRYDWNLMNEIERYRREQEFKQLFEQQLPEYARMCSESADVVVFHQDAFAADYQESEFCLLGKAVKYAGLLGKEVRVMGHNTQTLPGGAVQ